MSYRRKKKIGPDTYNSYFDLHELFFGRRLSDKRGASLIDIVERDFDPAFVAFSVAAAPVNNRGMRVSSRAPDDLTYEMYPFMRALVPRCLTFVCAPADRVCRARGIAPSDVVAISGVGGGARGRSSTKDPHSGDDDDDECVTNVATAAATIAHCGTGTGTGTGSGRAADVVGVGVVVDDDDSADGVDTEVQKTSATTFGCATESGSGTSSAAASATSPATASSSAASDQADHKLPRGKKGKQAAKQAASTAPKTAYTLTISAPPSSATEKHTKQSIAEGGKPSSSIRSARGLMVVGKVQGMPKFTGLSTDEEDESETPNKRSVNHMCNRQLIQRASHFLVTTKANGKAAVITAFEFEGKLYYILGSKNVHVVVSASDLSKMTAHVPAENKLAVGISQVITRHFLQLENGQLHKLNRLLLTHTLCGEYEDGEHIVPHPGSPGISWFALVPKQGDIPGESCDRLSALETLKSFGLPTVNFALHPKSDLLQEFVRLRRTPHMEGAVIDFMVSKPDGGYSVVETVKFKSVWYVLTRSVREILRFTLAPFKTKSMSKEAQISEVMQRINKTIKARSSDFLHLSPETVESYLDLYRAFVSWFIRKRYDGSTINRDGLAVHWSEFLQETKISDVIDSVEVDTQELIRDIDPASIPTVEVHEVATTTATTSTTTSSTAAAETVPPSELSSKLEASHKPTEEIPTQTESSFLADIHVEEGKPPSNTTPPPSDPKKSAGAAARKEKASSKKHKLSLPVVPPRLVVLTHGIPADGKSTRAQFISKELQKRGIQSQVIEQDQFGGDATQTLHSFSEILQDPRNQVVILSRCNSSRQQYAKYLDIARGHGAVIVGIMPREIMSEKLLLVCLSSLLARKGHATMTMDDDASGAKNIMVTMSFRAVFTKPSVGKDVDELCAFQAITDFKVEQSIASFLQQYILEAKKKPFGTAIIPLNEVKRSTGLDTVDYQQYRLPLEEVALPLVERIITYRNTIPPKLPTPTYLAVLVPENIKESLKQLCCQRGSMSNIDMSLSDWYGSHVTLVHKNNSTTHSTHWEKALHGNMMCTELTVQTEAVVATAAGVIGICVQLRNSDGSDASNYVASGVPHITGFLPCGMKPVDTIQAIVGAKPAEKFNIPPEKRLSWTGTVSVML
ncbi:hypothetical protein Pelo_15070 [Pelomyxa schiedti]|nr:hypothetical protein Pelo_15070 [Pelomyxa schiedti]